MGGASPQRSGWLGLSHSPLSYRESPQTQPEGPSSGLCSPRGAQQPERGSDTAALCLPALTLARPRRGWGSGRGAGAQLNAGIQAGGVAGEGARPSWCQPPAVPYLSLAVEQPPVCLECRAGEGRGCRWPPRAALCPPSSS